MNRLGPILVSVAAMATLVGCSGLFGSENAILEIKMELPPVDSVSLMEGREVHVQTQIRRAADFPFDVTWRADRDVSSIQLGSQPIADEISVITENVDTDLNIRVRFCREVGCSGLDDDSAPERRFMLERPFFLGQRSFWNPKETPTDDEILEVPEVTDEVPTKVDQCEIRGCVEGDPSASYCLEDGTHVCDS